MYLSIRPFCSFLTFLCCYLLCGCCDAPEAARKGWPSLSLQEKWEQWLHGSILPWRWAYIYGKKREEKNNEVQAEMWRTMNNFNPGPLTKKLGSNIRVVEVLLTSSLMFHCLYILWPILWSYYMMFRSQEKRKTKLNQIYITKFFGTTTIIMTYVHIS